MTIKGNDRIMDQQLEVYRRFAEPVLNDFVSTPHNQRLIILVGGQNPVLLAGLQQLLNPKQYLMVVDYQECNLPLPDSSQIVCSCGDSIADFEQKLHSLIGRLPELSSRCCLEQSEDGQRTAALQSMESHISPLVYRLMASESYFRESAELELYNTLLNIPLITIQHGIGVLKQLAPPQATAVVIGAGPSLVEQLDWLKKNREQVFIIAAGSAVRALESVDIVPEIYVEIDIRSFEHWENGRFYDCNLVCSPNITPGFAASFKSAYWFNINGNLKPLLQAVCPSIDNLNATFNTGCISAELAAYMGFSRVVFLGIDLCISPEGQSHSKFHNQGNDNVIQDQDDRFDWVENNLGQKCRTIFGKIGMITGFEQIIANHPDTNFIQASPKGVKLKGATYAHWQDISVPVSAKPELNQNAVVIPDKVKQLRSFVSSLSQTIKAIGDGEDIDQNSFSSFLKRIAGINAVLRRDLPYDAQNQYPSEIECLKEKSIRLLREGQKLFIESSRSDDLSRALYQAYQPWFNHGVFCNWQFELDVLNSRNPEYAQVIRSYLEQHTQPSESGFRIASRGKNRIQLQMYDNDKKRYSLAIGYYDWMEAAKNLVATHANQWTQEGKSVQVIICIGIMDTVYLQLLRRFFPGIYLVVIEPETNLFAEVLRFIPIISMLGEKADFLIGESTAEIDKFLITANIDKHGDKTGIICADPDAQFFPSWRNCFNQMTKT